MSWTNLLETLDGNRLVSANPDYLSRSAAKCHVVPVVWGGGSEKPRPASDSLIGEVRPGP